MRQAGFRFFRRSDLIVLSLLGLAACGGGGDNSTSVPQPTPQNTAPVPSTNAFQLNEDSSLQAQLSASDADNDMLSYQLTSQSQAQGLLTLQSDGRFTYQPTADFAGEASFSFTVSDGKNTPVAATARLSIQNVNDAPTLTVTPVPALLDAGHGYPLQYSIADVDGDAVVLSNMQPELFRLNTAATSAELQVLARTMALDTELILQATDSQGATTQYKQKVLLAIPNGNGMGRTLVGPEQSNRLNLVIVGDGFTSAEQQKLREAAVKFSQIFFNSKEIGTHRDGWSLHVLDAVSAQSGADDPSTNTSVDTLFDGNLGCAGIDRLYCVNDSKVFSYVFQHYPQFDFVLVVGNSTKYGGAGGRLSTYTLHDSAVDVAIHELGHTFARLADEYVDDANAHLYLPGYCENCYANITQLTDLSQVKWRHWFGDPAKVPTQPGQTGVGLFEGGYYSSKGFYRPKDNSFMLALGQPIGEVNGEAWVNQLYQNIGMYHSRLPQQQQVVQARGQAQQFSFALSVGSAQQKVQWYLNGQVMPQFDNKTDISCCQDQAQNYQITAVITDISGLIKAPALVSKEVQWHVQIQ